MEKLKTCQGAKSLVIFLTILATIKIVNVHGLESRKDCVDFDSDREKKADVIISGTVVKVLSGVQIDGIYSAHVQIKRIFKGNDIIRRVQERHVPGRDKDRGLQSYNKVVRITGFGADNICVSEVKEGDTKLFLLVQDIHSVGEDLQLSSSIQSIFVYSLKRMDALAKGLPFDEPPPVKSPCLGHFCAFYAQCVVDPTTNTPQCLCTHNCTDTTTLLVCGTDRRTYRNECELQATSCYKQRRIKVLHKGQCTDPCDGVQCPGHQVCHLNNNKEPVCQCEPSCATIVSHVCGSDENTYSNECMMRQHACNSGQDITIQYQGQCKDDNPCSGLQCGPNHDCLIDRMGQAACVCPSVCDKIHAPVCGTDGVSYDSACELRRKACQHFAQTTVAHTGLCEESGPCRGIKCEFDGVCVSQFGLAKCICPSCSENLYQPVCGTNGISFNSECELRAENCQKKQTVRIEHRGLCTGVGCERNSNICRYGSTCDRQSNGNWHCVCPSKCPKTVAKVCGSDGVTYNNECELRREMCVNRTDIGITNLGECVPCNGRYCKHGESCESGVCKCPQKCTSPNDPVCASDDKTYRNECEMRKTACRQGKELRIVKSGSCEDFIESGDGSGALECDEWNCQYGGTCQLDENGDYTCACSFSCDAIRSPVCGSDGVSYGNKCEMLSESCRQQKLIVMQASEHCEFDEVLCDGASPVLNPLIGNEYTCDESQQCPAGSYCHLQFGKCCSEERLSDTIIRDCLDSEFGCCDDHITMATGPHKMGCSDECDCEAAGSLSLSCDPDTKQCNCKRGVGGQRCSNCLSGFWGLHLIFEHGNNGCLDCECNTIGSSRNDCNQNTGRCLCKEGYDGNKCNICRDTGKTVGKYGCNGPKSCDDLTCLYAATCQFHNHEPQCVCDFHCSEWDFPESDYVCASNGITYINECTMQKDGCSMQEEIRVIYHGPCRDDDPTPPPSTSRSRKTTRRDITSQPDNTPSKTPKPIATDKISRIDDRCLEKGLCLIPHSHCHLLLCKCDAGYIPTMKNTMCSRLANPSNNTGVVTVEETADPCEFHNCRHGGICKPDDDLGYRCLCRTGRTGTYCKDKIPFQIPSFSGSSYLVLTPLGKINGDFYLNIIFHSMNRDGILLLSSQFPDGTGQFISLALNNGHVEFRYDIGSGPKHITHPHPVSQDMYHKVVVKKMGQNTLLIVDESQPMAVISIDQKNFDLSGSLYLGYLPQNMSFIQEKIGMNLGFVGCIRSLTAGHMDNATIFNLEYPSSSTHIIDGIDISSCDMNSCQSIPCQNGGTCNMKTSEEYQCWCLKGYTGSNCEALVDPCVNSPCHPSATCSVNIDDEIICNCPTDREGQYCEFEKLLDIRVPEFFGDSYLVLHVLENLNRKMSIEIWFRTHSKNGVLLFTTQYIGGGGDFLSLNIVNSFLEFTFDLGDGPVKLRSIDTIEVNKWHKAIIQRKNREGSLLVDDGTPVRGMSQGSLSALQFSGSVYIGGFKEEGDLPIHANIKSNFTGVIQRLYINGKMVENMIGTALEKYHVAKYKGQPCLFNPCMNGGVCVPKMDKSECKCPKKYIGEHCEKIAQLVETSDPIRFTGQTYLQYFNEITQGQRAQKTNKFQFRFKTRKQSGMLVYQSQGLGVSGDYLAIAVIEGFVELSFNLGKQYKHNLLRAKSKVYASDGQWHTVSVERDQREGRIQVDMEPGFIVVSEPGSSQLDTDSYLWIGGKADIPLGLPSGYHAGFVGCLGDVYVNDRELHLFDHRNGATGNVVEFCH